MQSALGPGGKREALHVEAEELADTRCRTARWVQVVADGSGVDAWPFRRLPLADVGEKAADPVGVAGFGSVRVVSGSNAQPQLLERREWVDSAVRVNESGLRLRMPVGPLEKVHEVDTYRLFGLADLPVLVAASALELLTEAPDLVGERAVCSLTSLALSRNSPNGCNDTSSSRTSCVRVWQSNSHAAGERAWKNAATAFYPT